MKKKKKEKKWNKHETNNLHKMRSFRSRTSDRKEYQHKNLLKSSTAKKKTKNKKMQLKGLFQNK